MNKYYLDLVEYNRYGLVYKGVWGFLIFIFIDLINVKIKIYNNFINVRIFLCLIVLYFFIDLV